MSQCVGRQGLFQEAIIRLEALGDAPRYVGSQILINFLVTQPT
jgi:hypothetical protein